MRFCQVKRCFKDQSVIVIILEIIIMCVSAHRFVCFVGVGGSEKACSCECMQL